MTTKEICRVNNVMILLSEDESLIPIKPICEALGVNLGAQIQRLERDPILSDLWRKVDAVAADGKVREMICLPRKYIFGWLFSIDDSRVNEDVRPIVLRYKLQCYNVLYDYFYSNTQRQLEVNREEIRLLERIAEIDALAAELKKEGSETRKALQKIREQRLVPTYTPDLFPELED